MELLLTDVVRNGNYKSYCELFRRYYNAMCVYAMRVVTYREIAEEVVSDVYMKLWKNREQITVHTSFEAYLYRSVRNQALDYLKLKSYRPQKNDTLDVIDKSNSYADWHTPFEELAFNELYLEIESFVSALPKQCQLIFRLNRENGLRYREIADELQISIKTVETQMGRALKLLRKRLSEHRLVA
ncbi:RNA polymerase sigma-70 factor [Ravibacter arvi]|uniref:RNA polymerase sigma-70 factor n=2 Tax=Ravibacter arvi TaxID=2051041 RepID=A0ABP8M7A5_9BACT